MEERNGKEEGNEVTGNLDEIKEDEGRDREEDEGVGGGRKTFKTRERFKGRKDVMITIQVPVYLSSSYPFISSWFVANLESETKQEEGREQ